MKTSRKGLMAIAKSEGIVLSRYQDAVGVWTIGIGHTVLAGKPDPKYIDGELSIDSIFEMFEKDIKKYEDRVNRAVKVSLSQHEFDALVSFDYNTGGVFKAALTKSLNAGNRSKAADQFMNWTKAGGRKLDALVKRRKEERDIFKSGNYPKPQATLYPATRSGKVLWSKGKRVDLETLMSKTPVSQMSNNITAPKMDGPEPKVVETEVVEPKKNLIKLLIDLILKIFGKR